MIVQQLHVNCKRLPGSFPVRVSGSENTQNSKHCLWLLAPTVTWYHDTLQGKKSTQDEMGVAALKAVEIDDSLGGTAKQVQYATDLLPCVTESVFHNIIVAGFLI
jgi:hypothetical protein